MLEFIGVRKRYGSTAALADIDLTVPGAETSILLGPSGCGKSTLLRLVVGLIWPDQGSVRLKGQEITPRSVVGLRPHIGYMIQEGGLFPHLTGRQNIILMARHCGWEESRISRRLAELIEVAQIPADILDRFPAQLSGGQRQRVSLMRALMLDPEIILLDEPLGALDPMIRSELQADLKRIFKRLGKTVLMVTHDLAEAAFLGDFIVLLRSGRIVQKGPMTEILTKPADSFVKRFINAQRGITPHAEGELT